MSKRLVAVWVSNYMGIENQGFNLGGKYTFDFRLIDNTLTIEAKETINYVDLFQNSNSITNVTGIVGVNGTGKSSFLKLLNVIIAKKSLSSPVVLIFEEGNEYVYYDYIGIENLSFRRMLLPRIVVEMDSDIRNTEDKEILTMFKDLDLIFYNSIISSQNDQYLEENDNLINYSASYQFQKSINKKTTKKYLQEFEEKEGFVRKPEKMFNLFKIYEKERFKRQVIFFEWVNREDGKATNERFKLHLDEVNYPKQFSLWFDSQNLFDRWYKENPDKHDELVDLFLDCEKNVLESTFSDNEKVENLLKFHIGIVLCMSGNKDLESYFKKVIENIEHVSKSDKLFDRQDKWIDLVNNLAIKFSKLRGVFDIDYSEELWEFLSILIDVNEYFIAEIKYSWNPRSSGEESLISQFAELFTAITSDSKKGNVIISIDEGEAYFHPEWQRKYISGASPKFRGNSPRKAYN
ncbi:AAA family ATPase [Emticicia sp. ODNR4P]|nr:AAA family ATPase [Emticicia sp. ODNR4P]